MGSIPPEGSVWFLPHILDYVYVGIFFFVSNVAGSFCESKVYKS